MKKFLIRAFILLAAAVSAGEREELLKTFEKENAAADKLFDEAFTTLEMTAAAGNSSIVAEKQLFRALDHKLRHTPDAAERLQILAEFHGLSCKVQSITAVSRKGMGSMGGAHIYNTVAALMQQRIAVLMLDPVSEQRWKKIAGAELLIEGNKLRLRQGMGNFKARMHDENVTLEIRLHPRDTFTCRNRIFALIRTDILFAGNYDFSRLYLCELKKTKLHVHTRSELPAFSRWILKEGRLTLYKNSSDKKGSSIKL